MPYPINLSILDELGFDEKIMNLPHGMFSIEKDFLEEKKSIQREEDDKDYSDYDIKDLSENEINDSSEKFRACVDEEHHILYTGIEVTFYIQLKEKILNFNAKTLNPDVMKQIDEVTISEFKKMMRCFQTAYSIVHPDISLTDIVRYRLAHHLLLLPLNPDAVTPWIHLLKQHDIVDYSIIKSLPYQGEAGILYVPKDRSRAHSTFKNIYTTYISNPIKRDLHDIYDPKITFKQDAYYINNERIKKIVFLFDLIQKGGATIKTLEYYLKTDTKEDNLHVVFNCNGRNVSVAEILETNVDCEVEIYSIYAGTTGQEKVKAYLEEKMPDRKCTVLKPLSEITHTLSEDDDTLRKTIYKGPLAGQIYPGDYMIIREYNQPKHNIMSNELMELDRITALFCKRAENY